MHNYGIVHTYMVTTQVKTTVYVVLVVTILQAVHVTPFQILHDPQLRVQTPNHFVRGLIGTFQ